MSRNDLLIAAAAIGGLWYVQHASGEKSKAKTEGVGQHHHPGAHAHARQASGVKATRARLLAKMRRAKLAS